eukprot:s831_g27.t1
MIAIVRLDAKIPYRVIARPNVAAGKQKIAYWQVAWFWPAADADMDAWLARKHWLEQRPDSRKSLRALEEMPAATPAKRSRLVRDSLASPSFQAPPHTATAASEKR